MDRSVVRELSREAVVRKPHFSFLSSFFPLLPQSVPSASLPTAFATIRTLRLRPPRAASSEPTTRSTTWSRSKSQVERTREPCFFPDRQQLLLPLLSSLCRCCAAVLEVRYFPSSRLFQRRSRTSSSFPSPSFSVHADTRYWQSPSYLLSQPSVSATSNLVRPLCRFLKRLKLTFFPSSRTMDIRTLLYLILGMPLLVHAVTLSSGNSSRPRLSRSRSLRSSTSSRRNIPSADPPSFFVPSTTKLPLTALAIRSDRNSHLHPQILLQQHLNRGIKRHSRMTRRSSSSDNAQLTERLSRKIQKRWDGLQASSTSISSSSPPVTKRWRAGEALAGASAAVQHMKDRVASILSGSTRTAATNVGLAASASARVDVSGVAGASVAAQRAARITATAHSTVDGDGEGFDSLEYAAAMNNTNLDAEPVHCRQLSRFDHRGERRRYAFRPLSSCCIDHADLR